jgi:hypothetical protein
MGMDVNGLFSHHLLKTQKQTFALFYLNLFSPFGRFIFDLVI